MHTSSHYHDVTSIDIGAVQSNEYGTVWRNVTINTRYGEHHIVLFYHSLAKIKGAAEAAPEPVMLKKQAD